MVGAGGAVKGINAGDFEGGLGAADPRRSCEGDSNVEGYTEGKLECGEMEWRKVAGDDTEGSNVGANLRSFCNGELSSNTLSMKEVSRVSRGYRTPGRGDAGEGHLSE